MLGKTAGWPREGSTRGKPRYPANHDRVNSGKGSSSSKPRVSRAVLEIGNLVLAPQVHVAFSLSESTYRPH